MKQLYLEHEMATLVLSGEQKSTWRVFDDSDFSVNDEADVIDTFAANNPASWRVIGTAVITKIIEKRLAALERRDVGHQEWPGSPEAMLERLKERYGAEVTLSTPVKLLFFDFMPTEVRPVEKESVSYKKISIFADGGSRGNPGPSAGGYVLFDADDRVLVDKGIYLGITTNNQAEYQALKAALEEAQRLGAGEVNVHMDSMLVINQMNGVFKVKNRDLWPIHDATKRLAKTFKKVTFTYVPREFNKLADAAVNRTLDEELDVSPAISKNSKDVL